MRLADLVATSQAVAATPGRSAKVAALAELLRAAPADEIEAAVAFLTGEPRQGRIGIGWATAFGVHGDHAESSRLTVADVDGTIDRIEALTGPGSVEARRAALGDLFGRATEEEASFLRRLFTGELRQGALEGLMADAVAQAAGVPGALVRRACMLAGDLPRTASVALSGGAPALRAIGLEVLRPVQPMLAATSASVADALESNRLSSVEWKLDGARIQAHRRGADIRLFTRNLNDVTDRLPGVVAAVRSLPLDTVVLDGEVTGGAAFQDTMSQFGRHAGSAELGVWLFDVLHLDGVDLIDAPLVERAAALERIAPHLRVPSVHTDSVDTAEAFLAGALAAGHEGVMVKALSSPYEAGRRGKAWRKVKPVHTLDLVVLAVEWGSGRRRGWLSNIHLGARDPAGGFVMVGKTFKGLTDETLRWQTARFLELETSREGHIVHLRPEQVVEIGLDGVQRSTRYPGGVALRFARVRRYRPDKSATEADLIATVQGMLTGDRGTL